jgi:hypothetical protein
MVLFNDFNFKENEVFRTASDAEACRVGTRKSKGKSY